MIGTAVAALYGFGYVTGSLLVGGRDSIAWTIIRLAAGLLLSSIAFLASLVFGLPWFAGPLAVLVLAVALKRWTALAPPHPRLAITADGVAAGILALVLVSPLLLSAARMAPGEFPPVFFSVDSAYVMEKVHSLTTADTYPPPSLSNLGGSRTYHYAVHGEAALLSRLSGMPPHQAAFGIVVPLLTVAVVAAAFALARAVGGAIPLTLGVPLLLISVPTFWYPFWGELLAVRRTMTSPGVLDLFAAVSDSAEMWGIASVEIHNIGSHFVVLASLAAMATAPSRGWRLPVFLIGTAILVKTPTGVALAAGFSLAQVCRMVMERSARALLPAVAMGSIFLATYATFWLLPPLQPDYKVVFAPLFHTIRISQRAGLTGLALDLLWLVLPALVLLVARVRDPEKRSLPLLVFALAPFVVVNLMRTVDVRPDAGRQTDDWFQILLTTTLVFHAFVLSVASRRWDRIGPGTRAAFMLSVAATIVPVVWVAGSYSALLMRHPEEGHEFADNRALGQVLRFVPVEGALLVTNDLRYPAQNFGRTNHQMQIPALFGHQAFAVNYEYEFFEFSRSRRELQTLLQMETWSAAIDDAARANGWTHLLIHKQYVHPRPIPLELLFENDSYAVYRFRPGA